MYQKLAWMFLTFTVQTISSEDSPVRLLPNGQLVTTPGRRNVTFNCILMAHAFVNVSWLLNGSSLDSIASDNFVTGFGHGIGFLTFTNLYLEYNNTNILCQAALRSGEIYMSEHTILLLQGMLVAVGDLNITFTNYTTLVNWTAPFSLNTADTTYDIAVVSSTTSLTLHMEDDVATTEFSYCLPPDGGCDNLIFTVTPQNEAGEGVPNSIALSQAVKAPRLLEVLLFTNTGTRVTYHLSMSSPVCSAEVILGDKNTGKVIMLSDTDLNISSTLIHTGISFTNDILMWNRQYMFRVNARNINGSAISSGDISTYDVVKSGIHTNPLRIHTEYLPNTNAAGVLYGFFYIGESDIDFSRSSYFALSRNESLSHELPSLLSAGVYYVHSYVIEQDKLLQSGEIFPATTKSFSGTGNSEISIINPPSSSEIDDCDISMTGLTISALCSLFSTSSSTGFMLVVQEKSVNGARRLLVNSTEQGEPQGPVTVQVAVGGAYQATVFPIREGMGILESNVAHREEIVVLSVTASTTTASRTSKPTSTPPASLIGVGVGLGVLALLAVILGAVILVMVCHRSRGSVPGLPEIISKEKAEANIEPSSKGEAAGIAIRSSLMYEEIGDVKSSFTYTQNAIYQESATEPVVVHRLTSDPVPEVPTGIEPSESHDQATKTDDYELMQVGEYYSMEKAYKVKQCSAYGIASSRNRSCELSRSHDPSKSHDTMPQASSRSCNPCNPTRVHDSCDTDQEENTSHSGVLQESHPLNDPWDFDGSPPGHSGASEESCDLNDSCACETDPEEIHHASRTASEKSCDLDDSTQAEKKKAVAFSVKSCNQEHYRAAASLENLNDPDRAEFSGVAVSSEKSHDLNDPDQEEDSRAAAAVAPSSEKLCDHDGAENSRAASSSSGVM